APACKKRPRSSEKQPDRSWREQRELTKAPFALAQGRGPSLAAGRGARGWRILTRALCTISERTATSCAVSEVSPRFGHVWAALPERDWGVRDGASDPAPPLGDSE